MSTGTIQERGYFVAWVQFAICNAIGSGIASTIAVALVDIFIRPHLPTKLVVLTFTSATFIASLPVSYFFFRLFVSRPWFRMHTAVYVDNENSMDMTKRQINASTLMFIGFVLIATNGLLAKSLDGSASHLIMAGIYLLSPIGLTFLIIGIYRALAKTSNRKPVSDT